MPTSRGEIRGKILRYLNKTADQSGFYSEEKVNDAIQEALNLIAVDQFLAVEGWQTSFIYFDTQAGQTSIDLPGKVALIRQVRYRVADVYAPMGYNDADNGFSYIGTGVQQAFSYWYRLMGRQVVFDPPLSEGGERYLQLEVVSYPTQLLDDNEVVDTQFDAACLEYVKYKCCSILSGSIEKEYRAWADLEQQWYDKMLAIVTRRNLASTPIREFL